MLNKVFIMGRMTRSPELRRTQNGTAVTGFTLAVDRDFKDKDGEKVADFIDCVAWRTTAEFIAKNFAKGRMTVVEGRLQQRDFKDKDGNSRRVSEVQIDNIYFGDSKRDSDNAGYSQSSYTGQSSYSRGSDSPRQSAPVPPVTPSPFEELEDDGELPF